MQNTIPPQEIVLFYLLKRLACYKKPPTKRYFLARPPPFFEEMPANSRHLRQKTEQTWLYLARLLLSLELTRK